MGEHHDNRLAHLCCITCCSVDSTQWLAVVGVILRLFSREARHRGGTSPDNVLMEWWQWVALGERALELMLVIIVCVLLLACWSDQERRLHCWGVTFSASHHVSDLNLISMRIWWNHCLENRLLLLELKLLISHGGFFGVICLASFLCCRLVFCWSVRWLFCAENWRSILLLDLSYRLATNHSSSRRWSDLNFIIVVFVL